MIDVKKLITGFLILATAAVCSGLICSLTNFAADTTTSNTAQQVAISGGTALADNTNAFLPTQSQVDEVGVSACARTRIVNDVRQLHQSGQ